MEQPIVSIAVDDPRPKKPHGNKGRVLTDKQKESLEKGRLAMIAMKQKREEEKAKKKEKEKKKRAGEPVSESESEEEVPPPKKQEQKPKEVEQQKPIIQYVPVKPRKERKDTGQPRQPKNYVVREDFDAFTKSILDTLKSTPMIKEVEKPVERVVEKPVEKVVEKTKVLTGSDLLNAIFFK